MRTLWKCIRGSKVEERDWEYQINVMLRGYRALPLWWDYRATEFFVKFNVYFYLINKIVKVF